MASKKIVWSSRAKSELQQVLEFYVQRNGNPNYSLKILKEVEELLTVLSKRELIGRLTSNKVTRVIPLKVYLVFYEINKDRIEILSFWDNRQDQKKRVVK
ncbi:MAG TPA: type II toxin-antitoxin system RelE/ParE family toxin [Fulvivirga sp.]|nr:type II toxin-antitoxin system RelE/ParE family toxin [Fulvivirga sp.]